MARLVRNLSMEGLQMRFVYLLVCFGLLTACGSDGDSGSSSGSDAGAGMNMGADGGRLRVPTAAQTLIPTQAIRARLSMTHFPKNGPT